MHAQQEICKIKQEMTKTLQGKTHKRRLNHRGGEIVRKVRKESTEIPGKQTKLDGNSW